MPILQASHVSSMSAECLRSGRDDVYLVRIEAYGAYNEITLFWPFCQMHGLQCYASLWLGTTVAVWRLELYDAGELSCPLPSSSVFMVLSTSASRSSAQLAAVSALLDMPFSGWTENATQLYL